MKIVQLLPTLAYGDGVGNDALAMDRIIKEMGCTTKIYAENIDPRIKKGLADHVNKMPELQEKDILIYHLAIGTSMNDTLCDYACKKIFVYHNMTPSHFFWDYSRISFDLCEMGRAQMADLRSVPDYCLADSEYNAQELRENGYECRIDVLPILIPFEDYEKEPAQAVLKKYKDDWVNIVFVGRIAPNKKQEDIIRTFYYYKKYINAKARLFLVGSYQGMERYYERLKRYTEALQLSDVYFTGHTKFDEILAYYRIADVFLCLSEHEGFCIPLLEAMYFHVPIVAYAGTAVGETLGSAGLQLKEKDAKVAAEMIHLLTESGQLREKVISAQNDRLLDFSYDKTKEKLVRYLKEFMG